MAESFKLDNYIGNGICREERQYALFLYNKLSESRGKKVLKDSLPYQCGIPENAVIERVDYEAAYMRDYFEQDKKNAHSFNQKLAWYVQDALGLPKTNLPGAYLSQNLGHCNFKDPDIAGCQNWFRAMMNSKPDLAVIYTLDGEVFLYFLECKYLSPEKRHYGLKQTEIQGMICDFITKHFKYDNKPIKKAESSKIIRFRGPYNENAADNPQKYRDIAIRDLINGP